MTEPSMLTVIGRMGVSLVLIIGLVVAGFWALKRMGNPLIRRSSLLKIISQISLGGRRSLCVVKVAGKAMVVGVTDHGISSLLVFDADTIPDPESNEKLGFSAFTDILSEKLKAVVNKSEK